MSVHALRTFHNGASVLSFDDWPVLFKTDCGHSTPRADPVASVPPVFFRVESHHKGVLQSAGPKCGPCLKRQGCTFSEDSGDEHIVVVARCSLSSVTHSFGVLLLPPTATVDVIEKSVLGRILKQVPRWLEDDRSP